MNMGHAIVIGGSMAGLLVARVLADYFERVMIVDRDRFPAIGEQRRGVPQGRHTHGLLAGGRRVLDELFPGISDALIARGALGGDLIYGSRWFVEGGCFARRPSDVRGLHVSRPLLEGAIRERVLSIGNITAFEDCAVEGLVEGGERVTGRRLVGASEMAADLVVDASGRGSQSPQWLEAIGYPKPEEERFEIALGYATRCFRRRPTGFDDDLAVLIPKTSDGKRGGVMIAQEGERWTVTLYSHFGGYPTSELKGFIEFAKTLDAPYIYDVISRSEPLCDGAVARFPASVRRHYEKLERFPAGYLVIGDALSSFSPTYGQGMSCAALQAMELHKVLAEHTGNLARRFFPKAAKVVDTPWNIVVGNDLRMPETKGRRSLKVSFTNWYISKLHRAAHRDPAAAEAFLRVANLLMPPPSILHPNIVLRVLKGSLFPAGLALPDRTRNGRERTTA
jgi:2-polyprenyl-6-methoxyphenol hydroxylase-like FAD-dependent oxidoreductase